MDSTVVTKSDTSSSGDRYGDPLSNPTTNSPFKYEPPSNVTFDIEPSRDLRTYTIRETLGDSLEYRPVSEMSYQEFAEFQRQRYINDYWKKASKTDEEMAREEASLNFAIKNASGEPVVDIVPTGNVTLEFGGRWNRTENPAVPVRLQRNGGFEFDQQIGLNLQGKIGDRVSVAANWNTQATFDFNNNIKVSYIGHEEDIIKDLQVGNVSMPLNNSLIRGAQNLFGVKTTMQFGHLGVTTLFSRQRGTTETLLIRGGAQNREFEIQASDYDEYRHFFLSHYFKKKFDDAYAANAIAPNNGLRITRVEAWVTNTNTTTDQLRNILGLSDLGENGDQREPTFAGNTPFVNIIDNEGYISNPTLITGNADTLNPANGANNIWSEILSDESFRISDNTIDHLQGQGFDLGTDFEKINSARKLEAGKDFTFHQDLGFISLTSRLQDDEALAVAYEYTMNGKTFKVGELQEDYSDVNSDEVIVLKLLKPQSLQPSHPIWDLMMKNIYSLNSNNIRSENFQFRIIYKDDETGIDNPSLQEGGITIKNVPIMQLLGLDKMNLNLDLIPDGNFDFIENYTVIVNRGKIILPRLEPFGQSLTNEFNRAPDPIASDLIRDYSFDLLYEDTKKRAQQETSKNKFFLKGSYQSASSTDISLPGINIAEGSVQVTVGSNRLQEGLDYTVNYSLGRVTITNEGVLASGGDIRITYEKSDLFGFRNKSLVGTRLDYTVNDDINIGATLLHMSEQPFVTRINVGDETIKNTALGMDLKYKNESRILTRMIDFLPVIQTMAKSNVAVDLEVAALIPGNSRVLGESGTSYVDDFEGAETPFDFSRSPQNWRISSTPRDVVGYNEDSLRSGYGRAKLSWYSIDPTFFKSNTSNGFTLPELETGQAANHFVRAIIPQEIFPNRDAQQITLNTNTLDLAYYPQLRGPYNYNTDPSMFNADATFVDSELENNWAGITRAITFDTDFDAGNVEYIEFWMMNPFHTLNGSDEPMLNEVLPNGISVSDVRDMGGSVYFNLGDVSEDVTPDNRHGFENGLPENVGETEWGRVTTQPFITNAFDNNADRSTQDVGYDGFGGDEEQDYFAIYANELSSAGIDVSEFTGDPSSDDFEHYTRDEDVEEGILSRYLDYNGTENNSPINDGSTSFPKSNYNTPDNEDMNNDKTINLNDNYYEYRLDLEPALLENGDYGIDLDDNPFVVDQQVATIDESSYGDVIWYQVRIPIKTGGTALGNISSFQTIKFFRMYLTDFKNPILLRMAQLQLVSSQWRALREQQEYVQFPGVFEAPDIMADDENYTDPGTLTISTVNIEENGTGAAGKSPYRVPPGIRRDFDPTTNVVRLVNEQSLQLEVNCLHDGYNAGVFRNIATDLINYGRIRVFVHAETEQTDVSDGQLFAFLRLGTDQNDNYYEVSVPLNFSDVNSTDPKVVWPSENEIDISLDELVAVKVMRDAEGYNQGSAYPPVQIGQYYVSVKGNPDRSTVRTFMLGVRNPSLAGSSLAGDDGECKSARVWFNELRVTDFDKRMGWAARGSLSAQLADLGNLTASGGFRSIGYGDIESKISERDRANTLEYGVATNLAMDKFLPKKFINLPLYLRYDKERIAPQYDPLNPDVEFKDALTTQGDETSQDAYKEKVVYEKTIRSAQLTSVKLIKTKKDAKKHFFDPHNITVGLGVTEERRTGLASQDKSRGNNVALFLNQNYNGSAAYNYSFKPLKFEPFAKSKSKIFKKKTFALVKDFNINFMPSSVAVKGDLRRSYLKTQLYNSALTTEGVTPTYEKRFTFDRSYTFRWGITKSINLNYQANTNALIDEPLGDKLGDPDEERDGYVSSKREYRDSLFANLRDLGRMKQFNQTTGVTYKIPINRIPLFDWVTTDVRYNAGYTWIAGPLGITGLDSNELGHTISNTNSSAINGKLNVMKLYDKVPWLKKVNGSTRRRSRSSRTPARTTGTRETTQENEEPRRSYKGFNAFVRGLLMVRSINGSYKVTNNTVLPGYLLTPNYFGLTGDAPGVPFILGSQNLALLKASGIAGDWFSRSSAQNQPITQTYKEDITVKATIEPFKAFRINANASYSHGGNYSENLVDSSGVFNTRNEFLGGNYEVTTMTLKTAFKSDGVNNANEVFTAFSEYRSYFRDRLNQQAGTSSGSYDLNSQDVLIPAFLAAYSGKDYSESGQIDSRDLKSRPRLPLPNWRFDYSGLSRLKRFRKKFSSINLTHSYSSKFSVGRYNSSLLYQDIIGAGGDFFSDGIYTSVLQDGVYQPGIIIDQVVINERFSPLVGINIRTKKKMTFRLNYNKSRNLTLNLSNSQVTEIASNDFQIGWGYSKKGWKPKFFFLPERLNFPNLMTFKFDLTVRDTRTTQRSLESDTQAESHVVTNGNLNFRMQPNINYQYNKKVNIQLFFERTINEPRVSSSFRRTGTAFGARLRFSL